MKLTTTFLSTLALASLALPVSADESMDKMWGDKSVKDGVEGSVRAALFRDGTDFAKYLRPIAASIKGTVPSTSFVTAPNTSLKTLGKGTAATKSPDNKFECLHVLNPPTGTTLDLPVPADAKKFTSATMLVSGRAATLVQDATGVNITIPEAWDPLNTVIKLAAR
jgi:hypothetical protein